MDVCLPVITAGRQSKAPRGCPRVLLLGGPGCGAETLATALSQRFGSKLISGKELLQAAALSGSVTGAKAKPFVENGIPEDVPDDVLMPILLNRLDSEDVRKAGFVMVGCPYNSAQLAMLKKKKVWFRHVVYLQVSAEDAKVRKKMAALDCLRRLHLMSATFSIRYNSRKAPSLPSISYVHSARSVTPGMILSTVPCTIRIASGRRISRWKHAWFRILIINQPFLIGRLRSGR